MRFFVLPIFDDVIMDGHPIFCGGASIHHNCVLCVCVCVCVISSGFIGQNILLHHFIGFI